MRINRKKIILFSLSTIISIVAIIFVAYKFIAHANTNVVTSNVNNQYTASVFGAVKNPGEYKFTKPKTVREIIFSADVLTSADLTSLEMEKIISEDSQIVVPFKVGSIEKIKWKDLNSVEQLTQLGVKSSIAQSIIKHRRENETTTWEEILAIRGIGPVTLSQLKDIIDLSY